MIDPQDPFKHIREAHLIQLEREALALVKRRTDVREMITSRITVKAVEADQLREHVRDLVTEKLTDDSVVIQASLAGAIKSSRVRR